MRPLVWVVDDSALDATHAQRALVADCETRVFADGSSALEQLATASPPDVLVLDWVMPGVSGIELVRFMRSEGGALPRVPVLLLTAQNQPEQIVEGLSAGANDYLVKPYHDEELRARVAALVRTALLVERLHHAEESVRTLLANAPDPLLVVDAQGAVTFANNEAGGMFRVDPGSLQGQGIAHLLPDFPFRNISIGPGAPLLPLNDVVVHGRIYSPSVRVLPTDTSASTTIALRDVTERRREEARRIDFYSMMAHDLRSPLHSMLMRTDFLVRGRRGPLPPEAVNEVRGFQASIRSMVKLIKDFLDLASMEGVGFKIGRERIDVPALVRRILDELRPVAESSNVRLELGSIQEDAVVLGDSHRLAQVLTNLVGNGIKYTPSEGQVVVSVRKTDTLVEVEVADTGVGIAPEVLPVIFDRFTRAPQGAARRAGWGLGLMIVREIVEAHGGRVGVRSETGKGSRFWFSVPRADVPVAAIKASATTTP